MWVKREDDPEKVKENEEYYEWKEDEEVVGGWLRHKIKVSGIMVNSGDGWERVVVMASSKRVT